MKAVSSPSSTTRRPLHQRILSIHFPYLPADRVARRRWGLSWLCRGRPDHAPFAFVDTVNNTTRLVALDPNARAGSLRKGQGLAEARAICPDLEVFPSDPDGDRALLARLADWCDRYTPLVALNGEDGLLLDITGCAHLHGGEAALLEDLLFRLRGLGMEARGALSPTVGLSWAAARHGLPATIPVWAAAEILAPLPVEALRLPDETAEVLRRVGLKRVGDLLDAPRAPLAHRFGPLLLQRLDQALGREDEPISPRLPVPAAVAERQLLEPVREEDALLSVVGELAGDLQALLERKEEGGRLFELRLFRVDGRMFRLRARSSLPLRAAGKVAALYRDRFAAVMDDIDAGYGFEMLRLAALRVDRFDAVQEDFSSRARSSQSLAAFVDRVEARLGADHLFHLHLAERHSPEQACDVRPLDDVAAFAALPPPASLPYPCDRPVRLLDRAEPLDVVMAEVPEGPPRVFFWRKARYQIRSAEGPERISTEWWSQPAEGADDRDYFRVEDTNGRRFWLYRKGSYKTDDRPRWFMQGFFP